MKVVSSRVGGFSPRSRRSFDHFGFHHNFSFAFSSDYRTTPMHVSPFVHRFELENLKSNLKENHLHHLRTQTALNVCLTSVGGNSENRDFAQIQRCSKKIHEWFRRYILPLMVMLDELTRTYCRGRVTQSVMRP